MRVAAVIRLRTIPNAINFINIDVQVRLTAWHRFRFETTLASECDAEWRSECGTLTNCVTMFERAAFAKCLGAIFDDLAVPQPQRAKSPNLRCLRETPRQ